MKGAGTAQHSLAAATQRVAPQRYRNSPRGIATVKQCVEWQSNGNVSEAENCKATEQHGVAWQWHSWAM